MILFPSLAFFVFYKGYVALCKGPSYKLSFKIYLVAQIIMCVLFFILTIAKGGSSNGFMKLKILSDCGLGFSTMLAIVEIIIYYVVIAIGALSLWKARSFFGEGDHEPFEIKEQQMQD